MKRLSPRNSLRRRLSTGARSSLMPTKRNSKAIRRKNINWINSSINSLRQSKKSSSIKRLSRPNKSSQSNRNLLKRMNLAMMKLNSSISRRKPTRQITGTMCSSSRTLCKSRQLKLKWPSEKSRKNTSHKNQRNRSWKRSNNKPSMLTLKAFRKWLSKKAWKKSSSSRNNLSFHNLQHL